MSATLLLVRAENRQLRHHVQRRLPSRAAFPALLVTVAAAATSLNLMVYLMLREALTGVQSTLAGSDSSADLLQRAVSVLPFALALGPAAAVLVLHLVSPHGSPLLLHARMAGVSRRACGAARYLGHLAWGLILGLGLLLGGGWALAWHLSPRPAMAMVGMILLGAVATAAATTVLTLTQSTLTPVLRSAEATRSVGLLLVCLAVGLLLADVMHAVTGSGSGSVVLAVSGLWGGPLPDHPGAHLVLVATTGALVGVGLLAARSDAAGGGLPVLGRAHSVPQTGYLPLDLTAREIAQVLRDPVTRVATLTTIFVAGLAVLGVFAVDLHPGVAVLLVVLLTALGAETVHGRSRQTAWNLLLAGVSPARAALIRTLPYLLLQGSLFLVLFAPVAVSFGGPLAWAEAVSLFALTFSVALLSGTVLPLDRHVPTGVAITSVLTLSIEAIVILAITVLLRLEGLALVLVDLGLAVGVAAVALRLMARALSRMD
ncbi:hypothetical protein [Serinicoccus sediminis]|uniref:hypothetical protein n=1 Tax=Serinicoccus sediminis TaxID=2306021 RepID=UPI00102212AD|nr:hypothetical protein [Serinicoccus sediminis]